jgi:omega-amidase
MQNLIISIVQSDLVWEDIDTNLNKLKEKITNLSENTDLIILPEMFNTGFSVNPQRVAEELNGKTLAWMQNISNQKNCVITGSFPVKENGRYFNRLIWMNPDGSYQHSDKRHLFTMGDEHTVYSGGNKKIIAELKGWKVLPLICYDLRFPVWSKNTYKNSTYEYDLLIYVANWPKPRSHVWKALLKARALENLAYVAGVNRVGIDGRKLEYSGDSRLVDYLGNITSECKPSVEEIITRRINYEALQKFRSSFAVGPDWDKFEISY